MEKVSVVIPTKNRLDVLLRAINSVLNQEGVETEIIIVDDGSTDGTSIGLEKFYSQIKLIRNKISRGGAVARNQGALSATSEYVAFLDSDDEWLPNHLVRKVSILKNTGADGVFGTFLGCWGNKVKSARFYTYDLERNAIGNLVINYPPADE